METTEWYNVYMIAILNTLDLTNLGHQPPSKDQQDTQLHWDSLKPCIKTLIRENDIDLGGGDHRPRPNSDWRHGLLGGSRRGLNPSITTIIIA